jgi:hypothetical protein
MLLVGEQTVTILDRIIPSPRPRPAAPPAAAPKQAALWAEARSVFSIYLTLAKQFDLGLPFANERRSLPEQPAPEMTARVFRWLEEMDQQIQVYQLRQVLQTTTLNASEESLRSLIFRHLHKQQKSAIDRDKIDFLLVQYFALCAPAKMYHKHIELADAAHVLKPVLGDVDPTPLEWCAALEEMIATLGTFRSLRDILQTRFIEQGRKVKDAAGGMFYDPAALIQFVRFNFLLRRTFIELMHADLIAVRAGLNMLEQAGVGSIRCPKFGLAQETVAKLKHVADAWKQPFQKEYTETAVNSAFERLLALRNDVELALEATHGKGVLNPLAAPKRVPEKPAPFPAPGKPAAARPTTVPAPSAFPAKAPTPKQAVLVTAPSAPAASRSTGPATAKVPAPKQSAVVSAPSAASATRGSVPATAKAAPPSRGPEPVEFETCMEKIWEQLIAAPPSRGRSMSTVQVGSARILMSSWEVAAFVSDDGQSSEDLRRAVVARAMVTAALESAKETGNATGLVRALAEARTEVSRLQERVETAKRMKNTEAAVNLGISTKRLVSVLDEAEKL